MLPQGTIIEHYADYYGDPELARWREVGAAGKASHIEAAWQATRESGSPAITDIGCGDGAVIQQLFLHGFGARAVGYEVSPSGVVCARLRQYKMPAQFEGFDGRRIPAADKAFDLVILSHVIEHVEDPRGLLYEAKRIGRFVFVEVPLDLNIRTPWDFRWNDVGHINLYNPILIRHLVQSTGMQVIQQRQVCPDHAVSTFHGSRVTSNCKWAVKRGLLAFLPSVATRLFTYHSYIMARTVSIGNKR
jgi:SAM-dependent methyltransferase